MFELRKVFKLIQVKISNILIFLKRIVPKKIRFLLILRALSNKKISYSYKFNLIKLNINNYSFSELVSFRSVIKHIDPELSKYFSNHLQRLILKKDFDSSLKYALLIVLFNDVESIERLNLGETLSQCAILDEFCNNVLEMSNFKKDIDDLIHLKVYNLLRYSETLSKKIVFENEINVLKNKEDLGHVKLAYLSFGKTGNYSELLSCKIDDKTLEGKSVLILSNSILASEMLAKISKKAKNVHIYVPHQLVHEHGSELNKISNEYDINIKSIIHENFPIGSPNAVKVAEYAKKISTWFSEKYFSEIFHFSGMQKLMNYKEQLGNIFVHRFFAMLREEYGFLNTIDKGEWDVLFVLPENNQIINNVVERLISREEGNPIYLIDNSIRFSGASDWLSDYLNKKKKILIAGNIPEKHVENKKMIISRRINDFANKIEKLSFKQKDSWGLLLVDSGMKKTKWSLMGRELIKSAAGSCYVELVQYDYKYTNNEKKELESILKEINLLGLVGTSVIDLSVFGEMLSLIRSDLMIEVSREVSEGYAYSLPEGIKEIISPEIFSTAVYKTLRVNLFPALVNLLLFDKIFNESPPEFVISCPSNIWLFELIESIAESYNIPSMSVVSLFPSKTPLFRAPKSTYIAVRDNLSKDFFVNTCNMSEDKIIEIGSVELQNSYNNINLDEKNKIKNAKKSEAEKTILIAAQPFYVKEIVEISRLVLEICAGDANVKVLLKPHPSALSDTGEYESLRKYNNVCDFEVYRGGSVFEVLEKSSVVITLFSNVALEAALMNIPVLTANFEWAPYPISMDELGVALHAENRQMFESLLTDMLYQKGDYFLWKTKCAEYIEQNSFLYTGSAANRALDFIQSKINETRVH